MAEKADPTDLRAVFAANLYRLRVERGLTQQELAEKANVGRIYVWQLEHCIYSASLKIIQRLAEALDVEPSELLRPSRGRTKPSD
ncbi:MAG: helix-turn-helix domain-containing protein [Alphaproteobacteria bacterium]|nr:helix-turn-helix domain-containing protein [Alphaproteobacteria bacterium]